MLFRICLLALLVTVYESKSKSQTSGVECNFPHLLGVYEPDLPCEGFVVKGDLAYVAVGGGVWSGLGGMRILDISNDALPRLVSEIIFDFYANPREIAVKDGFAILGDKSDGLHIVDVTNPVQPRYIASRPVIGNGRVRGIEISGDYAYLACDEFGLQIAELTSLPSVPIVATFGHNGAVQDVAVDGDVACLAVGELGIELVDISDPLAPALLGTYTDLHRTNAVVMKGGVVYAADGIQGLKILDASSPASPALLSTYRGSSVSDVDVESSRAYLAAGQDGVGVLDVKDAAHPIYLGTFEYTPGDAPLFAREDKLFVSRQSFSVIDAADPPNSSQLAQLGGGINDWWRPTAIASKDDAVLLATGDRTIRVLDVQDPSNPIVVADVPFANNTVSSSQAFGIDLTGDIMGLAVNRDGITLIEIADPFKPAVIGRFETGGDVYDIQLEGGLCFALDIQTGLWILDMSDPAAPVNVSRLYPSGYLGSICVEGDLLYMQQSNPYRLEIYDVSSPSVPQLVSTLELPEYGSGPYYSNGYLYTVSEQGFMYIVDVHDPLQPVLVNVLSGWCRYPSIRFGNQRMYYSACGLKIYDMSDPLHPHQIGQFAGGRGIAEFVVDDQYLYAVDDTFGFEIIDISTNCIPCLPDTNGDGALTPADFTAWIDAFNNNLPACDQNTDGSCDPADFSAWIANYNAGC